MRRVGQMGRAGRTIALLAAAFAAASVSAATTYNIPSTYDDASGKWIGDAVALTNAITKVAKNDVIILAKGEYDLSFLAESPMVSDTGGYGTALIRTGAEKVTIRGETGDPKDVVLDGKGANTRIIYISGVNAGVMNVTIRGGNVGAACARYNYRNGGGVVFASDNTFVSNCIFTACYSERAGGAASGPYNTHRGRVIDCLLYGNSTGYVGGGAIANCALVSGCTVVSNIEANASGAAYGGGGIKDANVVTNCYIAYNYTEGVGGGVFNCANVYDSVIEHNVADAYVGIDNCGSGGAYGGKFHGCTFRDNCAASVCGATLMENCTVEDGRVNCLTNLNCVFRNLHNSPSHVWAKENVHYPDGKSVQSRYGFYGVELMRNCLITGCEWGYGSGKNVNLALFNNVTGGVENCTIADNSYFYFGADFKSGAAFVNCAIVRNTLDDGSTPSDVPLFESTRFCFSNCVWNVTGTRGETVVRDADYADDGCIELGAGVSPMFLNHGEHPYTPRFFSPLRSRGLVLDWMEDGNDLAGNPRLRDGKADVGCYQCWLDPVGAVFSIR